MFSYYLRLAVASFRRNPGITALMVLAMALGIAMCVMTLTVYHAMAGNPLWWKNDRVFAVTMDAWDPARPHTEESPALPPPQLTYRDARAVYQSTIPERKVIMYTALGVLSGGGTTEAKPRRAIGRMTTADFFSMFDVPFQYGAGWDAASDSAAAPVIVLSRKFNDEIFGGANSVGRSIRWDDHQFRIVGVLDEWRPIPRYFDLNNGSFDEPEDVYLPFSYAVAAGSESAGNTNCWKAEQIKTHADMLGSECVWVQAWVELPTAAARERMQTFIDSYANQQRRAGRFARPQNNRLTDVEHWLKDNKVVRNDNRILIALAFAFLLVCLINTVGLLLAKFLNAATVTGVRRALGASRRQIFWQHLTEVAVLALAGAALGMALAAAGLAAIRQLYTRGGLDQLAHFDVWSVAVALGLAVFATIAAGMYPAWRVGRMPPAIYLKTQ